MTVFVDVGAHDGQTLEAVVEMDFEHIYAYEPMPDQFTHLSERYGNRPNVTLCNYGLARCTGRFPVYGTNRKLEASMYPTKCDVDESVVTVCDFVNASLVFAELPEGLLVKLNCEGAEVEILDDLMDSGQIWKIADVLISFDVRAIAGMQHHEQRMRDRFEAIGFDRWRLWPPGATHQDRIRAWLNGS